MFVCATCGQSFEAAGFCTEDGGQLVDGSSDPLLGQTVGSYRLARMLGKGGMGAVYLGVHPGIGSRVAVKILSLAASSEPALVERFFAEALAVNVIRHESIVNVLDRSTVADGRPCITMEYLEGAPLSMHFAHARPFPLGLLARIGLEVLGALAAAHALGITHRDLKPDNIYITSLGRVKVLDFGIAKLQPEHGRQHDGTRTGALLGTPQYMSPEQALGQYVDPRSDIYSLGVILFEGATGRRPFEADSLFELLRQHIEVAPQPPRTLRPDLPAAFEAVIVRMLDKERGRRFQTAEECALALELGARGLPQTRPGHPPLVAMSGTAPSDSSPVGPAPTVGAAAYTLGETRRPSAASPGLWLGLAAVAIALTALIVGGVALTFGATLLRSNATAGAPHETAEPTVPGTAARSAKQLDVGASFATATAAARKEFSDAGLVSMAVAGIERDGTIDLHAAGKAISFVFRSPSAKDDRCLVSVSMSAWGTFVSTLKDQNFDCKQPVLGLPRCKVRDVLAEVAPSTSIHSLTLNNANGTWQWAIVIGDGLTMQSKPDNC
jgi:hypothetical protein